VPRQHRVKVLDTRQVVTQLRLTDLHSVRVRRDSPHLLSWAFVTH
jgi:hypothetical protein